MKKIIGVLITLLLIGLCAFALADVLIDEDHFPDEDFRRRVSNYYDNNRDSVLSDEEIASVTTIEISYHSYSDLRGIEYFTALKTLNCSRNIITTLDLSKNTALETVNCSGNQIEALTLGNLAQLKNLNCSSNKIQALNLTGCTLLCSMIPTGSFNVFNNYPGYVIEVSDQQDTVFLRTDSFTDVIFSDQVGIPINNNNFKDSLFMQVVSGFDYNGDSSLSLWERYAVSQINVNYYSDIESLKGIEFFLNLSVLNCDSNKIANLDLRDNKKLTELYCHNNRLKELDISGNPALVTLDCGQNKLISLDTSKNPALVSLSCSENQITDLSLGANKNLKILYCNNNELQKLDLRKNTLLETLYCNNNEMTSLKLSACKVLNCSYNKFTTLDVTACKELVSLSCSQNQLSGIDVTPFTQLTDLFCSSNKIIKLDLSKNKQLKNLNCSYNQLSALSISKNKKLMSLYCQENNITKVDISKCSDLMYLINNSQRETSEWSTVIRYSISNQNLYLEIDKFVTIKAGSTTIPGEGDPQITGDFSDSTGNYNVEKDEEGNYYATFMSPPDKNAKSLVIPATIRVAGVKVKVTAVDKKACYKMKKLTKLEIGSNVSKIGASAFAQCEKLKTITVETKKLTDGNVGKKAFDGIYKKPTFKCPKGYAETYEEIFSKKGAPKKAKYK